MKRIALIGLGRMGTAIANGMEYKDWSGIYEVVRKESGLD